MLKKIIRGGQTGEVAALRAAQKCGLATGGFMPLGFRTEDKQKPNKPEYEEMFGLVEMPTWDYPSRTRANVQAADATLILQFDRSPGTALTARCANEAKPKKPFIMARVGLNDDGTLFVFYVSPENEPDALYKEPLTQSPTATILRFLSLFETVNIAMNRDADEQAVYAWLVQLFTLLKGGAK